MRRRAALSTIVLSAALGEAALFGCGSDPEEAPSVDGGDASIDRAGDEGPGSATADAAGDGATHDTGAPTDGSASDVSDAGDASDVDDAGADADAKADAGPPVCATLTLGSLRTILPAQGDTTGATVAYDGCAKTATASGGVTGGWSLDISQLASFYRVSRTGWHTTLSPELPAKTSVGKTAPLQLVGTAVTGYDATKAHVVLSIAGPSDDCTKNGNTVALVGHPEAVVHYVDATGKDVGAATNADGLVWITNVDPAAGSLATLSIAPAVAGCFLTPFGVSPFTERVPLVTDTVTAVTMVIRK